MQERIKHPGGPYMFPSPTTGEMYHPDSVVNIHKKILKDARLPHIRFHDLRHTFASIAITSGADVASVSEALGHKDKAVTLRMYTHANEESIRNAAQVVRSAIQAASG